MSTTVRVNVVVTVSSPLAAPDLSSVAPMSPKDTPMSTSRCKLSFDMLLLVEKKKLCKGCEKGAFNESSQFGSRETENKAHGGTKV